MIERNNFHFRSRNVYRFSHLRINDDPGYYLHADFDSILSHAYHDWATDDILHYLLPALEDYWHHDLASDNLLLLRRQGNC